eukprot:103534-Pelagomonas_calceolata.AAC.2
MPLVFAVCQCMHLPSGFPVERQQPGTPNPPWPPHASMSFSRPFRTDNLSDLRLPSNQGNSGEHKPASLLKLLLGGWMRRTR